MGVVPGGQPGTVTAGAWEEQDTDPGALATGLDTPGTTRWTDVKFRKGDLWERAYSPNAEVQLILDGF